mgnify:CR=1 FL=1
MEKIPVNIISGFLGSGKTTAIIRLLEQKRPEECWAIVVNEFGKVPIDGQTLQSKSVTGSVFDILGGCICCSAKIYLKENLEKIVETKKFDRIIIEPSGLGGIEMVSEMVGLIPQLSLMPVICMVDITGTDNPKFRRIPICSAQIRMSDRIVFSKCDLLDSPGQQDELVTRFKLAFPDKHSCFVGTKVTIAVLNPPDPEEKTKEPNSKTYFIPAHHLTDGNFREQAFQFEADRIFAPEALKTVFAANPSIIRAKGHICTTSGWVLFNYTLSGYHSEPCPEKEQSEIIIIAEKSGSDQFQNLEADIEKSGVWGTF